MLARSAELTRKIRWVSALHAMEGVWLLIEMDLIQCELYPSTAVVANDMSQVNAYLAWTLDRCTKCSGKGMLPCATCGSRGLVKCQACQGQGSLIARSIALIRWYVMIPFLPWVFYRFSSIYACIWTHIYVLKHYFSLRDLTITILLNFSKEPLVLRVGQNSLENAMILPISSWHPTLI